MTPTGLTRTRLTPARWGAALAATGVTFGVLDAVWLGAVAKDSYAGLMGDLMANLVNVLAAAALYLISLSVIEGFPAGMVPIDIAWGTIATSVAAAAATALINRLTR